jgi:hypothetical protein
MAKINYFKFVALYSGDVAIIEQFRWIARMLRELIDAAFI